MKLVIDYIVSIFLTISTVFSLIPDIFGTVKTYSPEQDGILLNCAVVSDTHADNNIFRDRTDILRKAYAGIGECSEKTDVVLNIGDITNSGVKREYFHQKMLERIYIKAEHTVACLGNHDSWHESADPDYPEAKKLFLKYLKDNGIESDSVYYATVIDGYYFICLGTEGVDHDETKPIYSDEQLEWFERQLNEAEKSNLPVFVLSHRPLNGHNGMTDTAVPAKVDEILQNHTAYSKPIFFFSGHCHDLTPNMFDRENNVYYINLPSLEYNDETEYECNDKGGAGLTMEVYSNSVVIKARNFIKDMWIDGYRLEVGF